MADHDDHHLGLKHDLRTLAASIRRRRALAWLAASGAAGLLGCGGGGNLTPAGDTSSTGASGTTAATGSTADTSLSGGLADSGSASETTTTTVSSCSVVPEETAGPYPADGSNGASGGTLNALMLSGIVRSDIRSSIAGATAVAQGVPLSVELHLVNTRASCADLSGYAIYLWHCDRDGNYSLYSPPLANENCLRGVQSTDSSGMVTFTTIFPGCYAGRMPHIHFEVYRSETTAMSYSNKLKTSQLALPTDVCSTVYGSASGYAASVTNLARISFATDNVFSDGVASQLATVSGSLSDGYLATLVVGISI